MNFWRQSIAHLWNFLFLTKLYFYFTYYFSWILEKDTSGKKYHILLVLVWVNLRGDILTKTLMSSQKKKIKAKPKRAIGVVNYIEYIIKKILHTGDTKSPQLIQVVALIFCCLSFLASVPKWTNNIFFFFAPRPLRGQLSETFLVYLLFKYQAKLGLFLNHICEIPCLKY